MKRMFHDFWPLVVVALMGSVFVMQIPRKALMFQPVKLGEKAPSFAFVEFDDAAYSEVMRRARMSWQNRTDGANAGTDASLDAIVLQDSIPPPPALPLPPEFFRRFRLPLPSPRLSRIAPPTLGIALEAALPPPSAEDEGREERAKLLEFPDFIFLNEKENTP